ncbi:MAG: WG repeat-containing protein [Rikenellaceae bacterium]|nr:WG repeat-containing protein [Rikenellaceae bacterium]
MKISTNDIIDSLKSVSGSLHRLVGIKTCDSAGNPTIISCEDTTINFRVSRAKTFYKMSVRIDDNGEILSQCQNRATQLAALDSPALVEYEFHLDELAVSCIDGGCVNRSFTLEQIPAGESLKHWFEQEIHTADQMLELADRLTETAEILSTAGICHCNIKPQNIIIQPDGRIKLTDYRNLCHSNNANKNTDCKVLTALAVVALLTAKGILAPEVDGSLGSMSKLKRALELAHSRQTLSQETYLLTKNILNTGDIAQITELKKTMCSRTRRTKRPYELVGDYREDVAVAKRQGLYGYIDRDGNELTEFKYTMADDIYEGYAVVGIDNKLGIIHKSGKEILAAEYDDVLSPAECGMLAYRRGYKWSLFTLSGEKIGNDFDSVIKYTTGIVKVSKSRLWGLVDYRGEILVPFNYDDIQRISDSGCRLCHDGHSLIWRFKHNTNI